LISCRSGSDNHTGTPICNVQAVTRAMPPAKCLPELLFACHGTSGARRRIQPK
jgi:hypothetical protein